MSDTALVQLRPESVAIADGVAVVDLLCREMTEPDVAARLGESLRAILDGVPSRRILINTAATSYLSSTAFAVLLSFGRRVLASGGKVAICAMDPHVRVGADIVQLGRLVPIFADEAAGLEALRAVPGDDGITA